MQVPATAPLEYQKFDTNAADQYPGDDGLQKTHATYVLGSCGMKCEGAASGNDLGFEGFVYVGGTIDMTGDSDTHGAIWVQKGWSGAGNCMIFYDDKLSVPQLNVTLQRLSWQEVTPSATAWP
jgi:hypothetical protein